MGMRNYDNENEQQRDDNKLSCWIVDRKNEYIPCMYTEPSLPPGKYKIKWSSLYNRYAFMKQEINLDELLEFPTPTFSNILSDIDYFWDNKDLFNKYRYIHKRGILLYGNPGCGKTSITELLAERVVRRGGVVFSVYTVDDLFTYFNEITTTFRVIESVTPIMLVFEDLDALIGSKESETVLLNLLDGTSQTNDILHIGCTNHPEKLETRILNRPSRFDRRYYFGLPDEKVIEFYYSQKIKPEDIARMGGHPFLLHIVQESKGLTIAHLGEFIKSVFIFGKPVDETLELLHEMSKIVSSSKDEEGNIGFKKRY